MKPHIMGQLTFAKSVADNPASHPVDVLIDARTYLEKLRTNGGVRNSERASGRLETRLRSITNELKARKV